MYGSDTGGHTHFTKRVGKTAQTEPIGRNDGSAICWSSEAAEFSIREGVQE